MKLADKIELVGELTQILKKGFEEKVILTKESESRDTWLNDGWWTIINDLGNLLGYQVDLEDEESSYAHILRLVSMDETNIEYLIRDAEAWLEIMKNR